MAYNLLLHMPCLPQPILPHALTRVIPGAILAPIYHGPMTFSPCSSPYLLLHHPPPTSSMASQNLKRRPKEERTTTAPSATTTKNRMAQKLAMAKRGLRSLAIAIAIPFILTTLTTYISGTATSTILKPFWHPPVWAFNLASISASCLMGLSAWFVWAEGGFHRQPTTVPLFLAQFLLGLVWGPLVFRLGAIRVGLVVCITLFATLFGCSQNFHQVNPIAGDLVKPCLAWVSFLTMFNYKLI